MRNCPQCINSSIIRDCSQVLEHGTEFHSGYINSVPAAASEATMVVSTRFLLCLAGYSMVYWRDLGVWASLKLKHNYTSRQGDLRNGLGACNLSIQTWWYALGFPALGRLRKRDHEYTPSLGYEVRPFALGCRFFGCVVLSLPLVVGLEAWKGIAT